MGKQKDNMKKGTYTSIDIRDDVVIKRISPNSSAEQKIYEILNSNNDILAYIEKIKGLVKLPKVCYYNNENKIVQTFVEGLNVDEFLSSINIDNEFILDVFERLVKIYCNIKTQNEVTIDFNLFNFILAEELIYVDVVPPLFKEKLKNITISEFESQKQLFLNFELQLKSMICYFLQPFICNNYSAKEICVLYEKMLEILSRFDVLKDLDVKFEHIFEYRFNLLMNYLYDNKSVTNFKQKFLSIDIKNDLNMYKGE